MTLFEINAKLLACYEEVNEDGEFLNIEEIEALEMAREEKHENLALWVKNLEAEKEAVKAEKLKMADRQKKLENKIESIKGYLKSSLQGEKLTTARVKISYRNTASVNVTDVNLLDPEYLKPVEPVADKTAIKNALKAGLIVEGAEMVTNESMIIK